ncbi:MAG: TMEM43 family protein [Dokdonella sp.]
MALVIGLLAAAAVLIWSRWTCCAPGSPSIDSRSLESAPLAVAADHIDPANEGHLVTITGIATATDKARDPQLGISADALILIRSVQMFQWREQCTAAGACSYRQEWAETPIASNAFREPATHANPEAFPFSSARFSAPSIKLGAFVVDPALVLHEDPVTHAYAVTAAELPPNLAASFREFEGVLTTSNATDEPAIGDLRVSYRTVAPGELSVTGTQRGDRLLAPTASNSSQGN